MSKTDKLVNVPRLHAGYIKPRRWPHMGCARPAMFEEPSLATLQHDDPKPYLRATSKRDLHPRKAERNPDKYGTDVINKIDYQVETRNRTGRAFVKARESGSQSQMVPMFHCVVLISSKRSTGAAKIVESMYCQLTVFKYRAPGCRHDLRIAMIGYFKNQKFEIV